MPKLLQVGASGALEEVNVTVGGPASVVVTFDATPFATKTTTFAHVGATLSQRVIVTEDGESDESEMEPLLVSAWVSAAGIISLRATTSTGAPLVGSRRFNYQVG